MKKYAGYFLMAVLGGLVSLGGYALFQKNTEKQLGVPPKAIPAQLTGLTEMSTAYPDFTVAASTSVHAVVHIKTEYARKNNMYDNFFNFFGDSP